jgi:hypothetical protein
VRLPYNSKAFALTQLIHYFVSIESDRSTDENGKSPEEDGNCKSDAPNGTDSPDSEGAAFH